MSDQTKWVKECLSKKRYSSIRFAEIVAEKRKNDPVNPVELYAYNYPSCQGVHLTKRKNFQNRYKILRVC